jgi:hypothetical protein
MHVSLSVYKSTRIECIHSMTVRMYVHVDLCRHKPIRKRTHGLYRFTWWIDSWDISPKHLYRSHPCVWLFFRECVCVCVCKCECASKPYPAHPYMYIQVYNIYIYIHIYIYIYIYHNKKTMPGLSACLYTLEGFGEEETCPLSALLSQKGPRWRLHPNF